jgi:hypothetical protein
MEVEDIKTFDVKARRVSDPSDTLAPGLEQVKRVTQDSKRTRVGTRIMMATVPHVTSGSGLRKFQSDGFLSDGVYYDRILPFFRQILLIPNRNNKFKIAERNVLPTF